MSGLVGAVPLPKSSMFAGSEPFVLSCLQVVNARPFLSLPSYHACAGCAVARAANIMIRDGARFFAVVVVCGDRCGRCSRDTAGYDDITMSSW